MTQKPRNFQWSKTATKRRGTCASPRTAVSEPGGCGSPPPAASIFTVLKFGHAAFAKLPRGLYEGWMPNDPKTNNVKLQVKYEDMTARYANQIVLTTGQEEVFLDFSSGIIPDQGNSVSILPIHTRIAMPHSALKRFHDMLTQLFARAQETKPAVTKQ